MTDDPMTTETRIMEAAKKVFHRKGFDGARMQEIADEAGINKALLHYYYRSKENLFDAVFREGFEKLFRKIFNVMASPGPLEEKIRYICGDYISFMQENPYIPSFILNEIQHNPERVATLIKAAPIPPSEILAKLKNSLEEAGLKDVDHRQLVINMISLSVFPILAKPMLKKIFNFSEEEFTEFIEARKMLLPELILRSLQIK